MIAWIGQVCDGTLVWARPYVATMYAIIIGLGFANFTLGDYFKISSLYLIFVVIISIIIVLVWIKPDVSAFLNYDVEEMQNKLIEEPMSKKLKFY